MKWRALSGSYDRDRSFSGCRGRRPAGASLRCVALLAILFAPAITSAQPWQTVEEVVSNESEYFEVADRLLLSIAREDRWKAFDITPSDEIAWRRVEQDWRRLFTLGGGAIVLFDPVREVWRLTRDYGETFVDIADPPVDPIRFYLIDDELFANGSDTADDNVRGIFRYADLIDEWSLLVEVNATIVVRRPDPQGRLLGTTVEDDSLTIFRVDPSIAEWVKIAGTPVDPEEANLISRLFVHDDGRMTVTTPNGAVYRFAAEGGDPTSVLPGIAFNGSRVTLTDDGELILEPVEDLGSPLARLTLDDRLVPLTVVGDLFDLDYYSRPIPRVSNGGPSFVTLDGSGTLFRLDDVDGSDDLLLTPIFFPGAPPIVSLDTLCSGSVLATTPRHTLALDPTTGRINPISVPVDPQRPLSPTNRPVGTDEADLFLRSNDLLRTTDGGLTWQETSETGPSYADVNAVGIHFGLLQRSLRFSRDCGVTWDTIGGEESRDLEMAATGGAHLWTTKLRQLNYSGDVGESWRTIETAPRFIDGGVVTNTGRMVARIAIDAALDGPHTLVVDPTDTEPGIVSLPCDNVGDILPMAVAPDDRVYAATDCGLLRLDDNGTRWQWIGPMPEGRYPLSLLITPDNRTWLGTDAGLFVADALTDVPTTRWQPVRLWIE